MAVGDGVQQYLEFYKNIHKGENYDLKRMGKQLGPICRLYSITFSVGLAYYSPYTLKTASSYDLNGIENI